MRSSETSSAILRTLKLLVLLAKMVCSGAIPSNRWNKSCFVLRFSTIASTIKSGEAAASWADVVVEMLAKTPSMYCFCAAASSGDFFRATRVRDLLMIARLSKFPRRGISPSVSEQSGRVTG